MASRQIWRVVRSSRCFVSVCQRAQPLALVHKANTSYRLPLWRQVTAANFHTSARHANQHIINIQDEEDFKDRVLGNNTPVVVDFHAHWCGPCKLLGPRLESLIAGKNGSVILAKVDIDENADLAMEHGVEAVPTVLAVKNGKIVDKFIGLRDDMALEKFVNSLVGK